MWCGCDEVLKCVDSFRHDRWEDVINSWLCGRISEVTPSDGFTPSVTVDPTTQVDNVPTSGSELQSITNTLFYILNVFYVTPLNHPVRMSKTCNWHLCSQNNNNNNTSVQLVIRNLFFQQLQRTKYFKSIFICYIDCTGIRWRVLHSKWICNER